MLKAILITLLVLAVLPFIIGFISAWLLGGLRVFGARVKDCPLCEQRSLRFVEGLRPRLGGDSQVADLWTAYYECDRCEAHVCMRRGQDWRAVDDDEWDKILESAARWSSRMRGEG